MSLNHTPNIMRTFDFKVGMKARLTRLQNQHPYYTQDYDCGSLPSPFLERTVLHLTICLASLGHSRRRGGKVRPEVQRIDNQFGNGAPREGSRVKLKDRGCAGSDGGEANDEFK